MTETRKMPETPSAGGSYTRDARSGKLSPEPKATPAEPASKAADAKPKGGEA